MYLLHKIERQVNIFVEAFCAYRSENPKILIYQIAYHGIRVFELLLIVSDFSLLLGTPVEAPSPKEVKIGVKDTK